MAYTTIKKPTDYFNTKLYSGDGGTQSVTGVGFQPDFSWLKCRTTAYHHRLFNAVSGAGKNLISDNTNALQTIDEGITAFNADGFSVKQGSSLEYNASGQTYVSWNWKANGAGSLNEVGSIDSTVSVNTTSGFSICKWSGSGANATIGHGLGVAPKMIITKSLGSSAWAVYNENLGNTNVLFLDTAAATSANIAYWNNTSPTSTVFSVGTDSAVNHSGNDMVAYCFAEKVGYSKFGKYTGNGNTDGPFVFTGFKPAYVLTKYSDSTSGWWQILDNKRDDGMNPRNSYIMPNQNSSEDANNSTVDTDFLSNGFKLRATTGALNASGETLIYMAFAEHPFVSSEGVPCTAR